MPITETDVLSERRKMTLISYAKSSDVQNLMGEPGTPWTPTEKHYHEIFQDDLNALYPLVKRTPKAVRIYNDLYRIAEKQKLFIQKTAEVKGMQDRLSEVKSQIFSKENEIKSLSIEKIKLENKLGVEF